MVDTAKPAIALALAAALDLLLVIVVAGDVGGQVHEPAEQLLEKQVGGSEDGSLLDQLAQLVYGLADTGGKLITGLGDEHHVTGKVASGLVVLAVGDLPGEVRHEQKRVADPADGVVQHLGGGEGLVAALVGQDPDTGSEETLDDGVQSPEDDAGRQQRNGLRGDIVVEEVEDGGENAHVTEDIVQAGGRGTVEAVSRDGITDLLDGEVGDLELVAIGVQHLGSGLLFRGQGGQRGRRGRVARAVEGGGRNGTVDR